jgi:hypothetical protein
MNDLKGSTRSNITVGRRYGLTLDDLQFDETRPSFDAEKCGYRYQVWQIESYPYWSAIVIWDPWEREAVALKSQVIDLAEAQVIMEQRGRASL